MRSTIESRIQATFSGFVRAFFAVTVALSALGCVTPVDEPVSEGEIGATQEAQAQRTSADPKAFERWLGRVRETDGTAKDLYYAYYDAKASRPWFLSPMISAEVLRHYLARGNVVRATAIGDALLRWQHSGKGAHGARLGGAFPSEIEKSKGRWVARYLYDSGDSATVLSALLS
jgi:hypothetical protein